MKGAEDFLLLVLHAHVVAAAKGLLHSESFAGSSLSPLDVANVIVHTLLLLPTSSKHLCSDASTDEVTLYARELTLFSGIASMMLLKRQMVSISSSAGRSCIQHFEPPDIVIMQKKASFYCYNRTTSQIE